MQKKSFFLIVLSILLVSFYAYRETAPQGQYILSGGKQQPINTCTYQDRAIKGDNCYGNCPDRTPASGAAVKQCCDYKKGASGGLTKECECKDNVNPCTNEKKCATCMAYAEAGGTRIDDSCMTAVMCTLKNRVDPGSTHKPKVKTMCEAVAQQDGNQYNAYKCVCNAKDRNQKYCKCCAGTLTGDEKKEWEEAQGLYGSLGLDCSGFDANTFNNAGMNSWAKGNCKKVTPPDNLAGCATFDFYKC